MARITMNGMDEYLLKLSQLEGKSDGVIKRAIFDGAGIAMEAIQKEIDNIPVSESKWLNRQAGEQYKSVTKTQKAALKKGFGISQMEKDRAGDWNTKIGVEGYISKSPTRKFPKGLPLPMLARSIEKGTVVRKKYPFVRKAVTASKDRVIDAMAKSIDKDCENIMKK